MPHVMQQEAVSVPVAAGAGDLVIPASQPARLPRLTSARAPLTRTIEAVDESGRQQEVCIPAERALTVYVDKRELVTLMTLGALPELLVLGYLRNQRLVQSAVEVESITVDWETGAAAVRTCGGIVDIERRTARRVVTTGCAQGSVFGGLMDAVQQLRLPPGRITQSQLYAIVDAMRGQQSTYRAAGSVHGCALFQGEELQVFVEDVGRHNAIDTIAGWMWLHSAERDVPGRPADVRPAAPPPERSPGLTTPPTVGSSAGPSSGSCTDLVFYTTGRLTSEMVIKAAQMGIAVVVSRSGITQMGHAVAQDLGLCTIGRALNRRFLCYSGAERLELGSGLTRARPGVAAALL